MNDPLLPSQRDAIDAALAAFDGDASQLAAALVEYTERPEFAGHTNTHHTVQSKPSPDAISIPASPPARTIIHAPAPHRPQPNTPVIIDLSNVNREYKMGKNQVTAVHDLSLTIHEGEFVAITGASGSGKSTLLNLIGGLDRPDSGDVIIAGQNLAKLSDAKLSQYRNQTIGFVFQFFYLQPFLNVARNLEVPAMFARLPQAQRQERVQQLAEAVGIADRLNHLPRELSGGQMQRAAIARALINRPRILLADEPTGNLDSVNSHGIMELFTQVRRDFGTTVIVITHDPKVAETADRIIAMHDGAIQHA